MIENLVPLVASFVNSGFLEMWCLPLFALYFVISVPGIIRAFTAWR